MKKLKRGGMGLRSVDEAWKSGKPNLTVIWVLT